MDLQFLRFPLCLNISNEWLLNILFLSLDSLCVDDKISRHFHYKINIRIGESVQSLSKEKDSDCNGGSTYRTNILY